MKTHLMPRGLQNQVIPTSRHLPPIGCDQADQKSTACTSFSAEQSQQPLTSYSYYSVSRNAEKLTRGEQNHILERLYDAVVRTDLIDKAHEASQEWRRKLMLDKSRLKPVLPAIQPSVSTVAAPITVIREQDIIHEIMKPRPTVRLLKVNVEMWLHTDVALWISQLGLSWKEAPSKFLHDRIYGEKLRNMTNGDLTRLGLAVETDRQMIIKKLRIRPVGKMTLTKCVVKIQGVMRHIIAARKCARVRSQLPTLSVFASILYLPGVAEIIRGYVDESFGVQRYQRSALRVAFSCVSSGKAFPLLRTVCAIHTNTMMTQSQAVFILTQFFEWAVPKRKRM
eukprot:PhF_6_TR37112/c0_g1_i2/m.54520